MTLSEIFKDANANDNWKGVYTPLNSKRILDHYFPEFDKDK